MKEIQIGGFNVTLLGEDKFSRDAEVLFAVLAHGRTRSKATTAKFARLLLEAVPNLVCAVWDLPNHGDRMLDEAANGSWDDGNALHMVQMQAIIDQGATEAACILQYAPVFLPGLRVTQRVILGTSLGGYIAWRVAAEHANLLTAAVPIISSPDVLRVMETRWHAYKASASGPVDEALSFPPSLRAAMRENTERAYQLQKSPLPILAICGSDDPLVPPQCTIDWGMSDAPNQRVEIVPGVQHEVPREMIDLTAEYLISLLTRVEPNEFRAN